MAIATIIRNDVLIVGAIIIGCATNTGMFIAGRAVMGIGVQGTLVVAPALLAEIAHPRYRARISALYMSIYYFAAICSAAVCRGTLRLVGEKAWRIPCFLQIVGPVATLLMTATIPESPRWLWKQGRHEKALSVLEKYHANGSTEDLLVAYEYREIREALRLEETNSQMSYTDYLRSPGNLGNGIVSYYLSPILSSLGVKDTNSQLNILIGLQVWNFFASSSAAFGVDKFGRLIPFLFLYNGAYDNAWTTLSYSYPVEILTFSMRTKGQAIFVFLQTLGMSVNTWVNPIALDAIQWKYYGVYIAILVVVLVIIYYFFPETKNMTIEEIAILFDGDRAAGIANIAGGEQEESNRIQDEKVGRDVEQISVATA
ncbi:MFS general substrate transporter [Aaosphaeria arxii CBS 175.79]|uniref:MFS general substrate transporter n=1 Tax=Aaosphaeria arxii CBS 175.79 TaxID=1450172 RepID=A0A6A5X6X3_9PLEO|nr:MFS general substrate transporter [Aaosphaeria arxii CBS 175.79]KAF2008713.1 MFS general substrate transporter [Aaosphaeria arxii CBS 175.79]